MLWKDSYKIGVSIIDEQHKQLFDMMDSLMELLKNEFIVDKYDKIVEAVEELKDYTTYHFDTEESLMESLDYKKQFTQKLEHEKFKGQLNNINLADLDINHDESILELISMINEWLTHHILEKDSLIGDFINKK